MHNLGFLGIVVFVVIGIAELLALATLPVAFFVSDPSLLRRAVWAHGTVASLLVILAVVSFISERQSESPSADPWDALGFLLGLGVLPMIAAIVCFVRGRALGAP